MHNAARRVGSGLDRLTEPHSSLREAGDMVLTTWTGEELNRIGDAEELQLASARSDGTLRPYVTMWVVRTGDEPYVRSAYGPYVTMWVVRTGDEPYVRSAYGPTNPWFRRAKASGIVASAPVAKSGT